MNIVDVDEEDDNQDWMENLIIDKGQAEGEPKSKIKPK